MGLPQVVVVACWALIQPDLQEAGRLQQGALDHHHHQAHPSNPTRESSKLMLLLSHRKGVARCPSKEPPRQRRSLTIAGEDLTSEHLYEIVVSPLQ